MEKLKCYTRAAVAGVLTSLSGSCAYCVYDGYTRLHQDLCDCAKYGTLITTAFSHPLAIGGALVGVTILSGGYLAKHLYDGYRHHIKKESLEDKLE